MRIAQRSNLKKAKIAVVRKLAVVMRRMWRDGNPFRWGLRYDLSFCRSCAYSTRSQPAPVRYGDEAKAARVPELQCALIRKLAV